MMISFSDVVTHLWQSTLFAAVVGVGTLMLRRDHAAIRHAAWFAASLKFLVPFAALMAIGAQMAPRRPVVVRTTDVMIAFDTRTQAVPPPAMFDIQVAPPGEWPQAPWSVVAPIWLAGTVVVVAVWWLRWRRVAAIAAAARTIERGREVDALRRLERSQRIATPIRLVASDALLEPGVVGFRRPILVWPRAIGERLDEPQIATILAHEVAHVRRRDNLTAAVHMAVEAIFWFHPLVWWLGARLVDERERACDEAVVRMGGERQAYAESILTACRVCLEAPLACVSGVTGSDLRKRIERIMVESPSEVLAAWKKAVLAAVPVAALAVPIAFGVLNAPRLRAESRIYKVIRARSAQAAGQPTFEVASVKRNTSALAGKVGIQTLPNGRFTATNVTLRMLIRNAYMLQDSQLAGGPKWLDDDRFDIVAKTDDKALGDPFHAEQTGQPSRWQLMLRALIADRFALLVHREAREQSFYGLIVSRRDGALGTSLKRSTVDCAEPRPECGLRLMPGNMTGGGVTMSQLANSLAPFVGRVVFDRTALAGEFDFSLRWTPEQVPAGFEKKAAAMNIPIDPNGPSIFTALQEQLGLKLDAMKGPVDVLVVDRAEHPKEN